MCTKWASRHLIYVHKVCYANGLCSKACAWIIKKKQNLRVCSFHGAENNNKNMSKWRGNYNKRRIKAEQGHKELIVDKAEYVGVGSVPRHIMLMTFKILAKMMMCSLCGYKNCCCVMIVERDFQGTVIVVFVNIVSIIV